MPLRAEVAGRRSRRLGWVGRGTSACGGRGWVRSPPSASLRTVKLIGFCPWNGSESPRPASIARDPAVKTDRAIKRHKLPRERGQTYPLPTLGAWLEEYRGTNDNPSAWLRLDAFYAYPPKVVERPIRKPRGQPLPDPRPTETVVEIHCITKNQKGWPVPFPCTCGTAGRDIGRQAVGSSKCGGRGQPRYPRLVPAAPCRKGTSRGFALTCPPGGRCLQRRSRAGLRCRAPRPNLRDVHRSGPLGDATRCAPGRPA